MTHYERQLVYQKGVGSLVVKPRTTILYKDGIAERVPELDETLAGGPRGRERVPVFPQPITFEEGVSVDEAIESALNSPHPEERALLPQLAELKQRRTPDGFF